jgi:hypothetical protein
MNKWNAIITIVISIMCGVIANIGTPTIKRLFTKGISGYRNARLREYKTILETVLSHRGNPSVVIILLLKDFFTASLLLMVAILLLAWGYSLDTPFLKRIWFYPIGGAIGSLYSGYQYIKLVLYPKHTDKLARKIEKLESKAIARNAVANTPD